MSDYGMPGPGGSLGECALCGKSFVVEILLGKLVKPFKVPGILSQLWGHDDCLAAFQGKDWTELPEESPLRKAYVKANEEHAKGSSE